MAQYRKRGTNNWQIGIYLGKDDDGKKITRYEPFYGTKTQAKVRGAELELEIKRKTGSKGKTLNVGELLDLWLKEIKKTVYDRTFDKYEWHVRRLKPAVGHIQLCDLNPLDLKRCLEVFNGQLSPRTVKDLYCTLRTAFNVASSWDLIRQDVMRGIKPPQVEHKDRDILNLIQLKVFVDGAKTYKHYLVLRLLGYTGMRIGEVLGLKWGDINWETRELSIKRATNTKKRTIKATKTKTSPRGLTLDEQTLNLLKDHRKNILNDQTGSDDLIFLSDDGRPLRYNAIRRTKEKILKNTGLQHIRMHDLRHGAGSIMIDNGCSITEVAETLGQKPSTTAGIYSHAMRRGSSIASLVER